MGTDETDVAAIRLSPADLASFRGGSHAGMHRILGAHPAGPGGRAGLRFAVWVPGAAAVEVTGAFGGGAPEAHAMTPRDDGSGIWEAYVPGADAGARYTFRVTGQDGTDRPGQVDPVAFTATGPSGAASVAEGAAPAAPAAPSRAGGAGGAISIYQVHLDSWRRVPEEGDRPLTYREAATWLPAHLRETGFTHVELVATGTDRSPEVAGIGSAAFLAPPGGQGDARDFAALVAAIHAVGVRVLVRRTLAAGEVGRLLERPEARSILLSAAAAWIESRGVDGLRLDLPGTGDDGSLSAPAAHFAGLLAAELAEHFPGALLVVGGRGGAPRGEPGQAGGALVWRGDWETRTRAYFALDPIRRSHSHELAVGGVEIARSPRALLPLSCDGAPDAGALLAGMPGDERQRLAHLRLLLGYCWLSPGAKLLFMGGEFGQVSPWNPDGSLDWHLLGEQRHRGVLRWVAHLNLLYRSEPALSEFERSGFAWIDAGDREQSVICFLRAATAPQRRLLVVCNFTPVPRANYRVGVPAGGYWTEAINSDAGEYGGWGMGNLGGAEASPVPFHGHRHSLSLILPPLAAIAFRSPAR